MTDVAQAAVHRERTAAEHIPYAAHVSPTVVTTVFGDYLQVFRLGGASFESADDDQLNNWHERLNVLWRNLACPSVALWCHTIRHRERIAAVPQQRAGFAASLAGRYGERLAAETLMVNDLYLALVFRPAVGVMHSLVSRALARNRRRGGPGDDMIEALDNCAKLAQTLRASLARYDPESLSTYRNGGRWCSALLEYLAVLINGEMRRVPLPRGPLNEALATTRLLFGTEAIEYRLPAATRVGAMLGIKEYPTPSVAGMYNRLLSAPFPLLLTQSFTFLTKATAQGLLQRQLHRMANAGDYSREIAERYNVAVDLAVHEPRPDGDPRNFHAHLLTTTREITPTGLGAKTGLDLNGTERRRRGLPDSRQEFVALRERWAILTNEALKEAHVDARIDHRSLAAQGIDREPFYIPLVSLKIERRGVRSFVAERLRADYQARVERRLERQPGKSAEQPPAPATTTTASVSALAQSVGGDQSPEIGAAGQPKSLEELRREAQEAWLRMRLENAHPTGEGREREKSAARSAEDDLAL